MAAEKSTTEPPLPHLNYLWFIFNIAYILFTHANIFLNNMYVLMCNKYSNFCGICPFWLPHEQENIQARAILLIQYEHVFSISEIINT